MGKLTANLQRQPVTVIEFPGAAEPAITWANYDHVAPGTYPSYCRSAHVHRDPVFKRWTCAVRFDILDASLINVIARLVWFLNLGKGDKPHAGRRGNYWAAWCEANDGPPKRSDRMTPSVFVRRHATVIVEDVTKNHKGIALAEPAYSKIKAVLSWETGGVQ